MIKKKRMKIKMKNLGNQVMLMMKYKKIRKILIQNHPGYNNNYVYSAGAYRGTPSAFDHDSITMDYVLLRLRDNTISGTTGDAGSMYGLVFTLDAEL